MNTRYPSDSLKPVFIRLLSSTPVKCGVTDMDLILSQGLLLLTNIQVLYYDKDHNEQDNICC